MDARSDVTRSGRRARPQGPVGTRLTRAFRSKVEGEVVTFVRRGEPLRPRETYRARLLCEVVTNTTSMFNSAVRDYTSSCVSRRRSSADDTVLNVRRLRST